MAEYDYNAMVRLATAKISLLSKSYMRAYARGDKGEAARYESKLKKHEGLIAFDGSFEEYMSMLKSNAYRIS